MRAFTLADVQALLTLHDRGWTFDAKVRGDTDNRDVRGQIVFRGASPGGDGHNIGVGADVASAVVSFVDGIRTDWPEVLEPNRPRPIVDHPAYAILRNEIRDGRS